MVSTAKTLDQAKAVLTFIEAIADKSLRNTVSLTAARGRVENYIALFYA